MRALILLSLLLFLAPKPSDHYVSVGHLFDGDGHCTVFSVRVGQWLGAAHCAELLKLDGVPVTDIKIDAKLDLRLVAGPIAPPFPIAKGEPEVGEAVMLYGWTDAYGELVDYGKVKPLIFFGHVQLVGAPHTILANVERNLFDLGGGPGVSGGPIVNEKGEVVGVAETLTMNPSFTVGSPTVKQIRSFLGMK